MANHTGLADQVEDLRRRIPEAEAAPAMPHSVADQLAAIDRVEESLRAVGIPLVEPFHMPLAARIHTPAK